MAIIKGTFSTNLKGRVGSVVYRNRNGKNIATQIPASVKNPQSLLQQQQRMKFNSVAQAYKCLKSIADHSFEGVTYGAPSQAKFMSLNTKLYTLTGQGHGFVAKGNSAMPMGNFKISEGTLPSLGYSSVNLEANPLNILEAHDTGLLFDNIMTDADGITTHVTTAQLLQALGVSKGDQVSIFVVRTKTIEYFGANNSIPQCVNTELVKCSFTIAIDAEDSALAFTGSFLNPAILAESDNISYFNWSETEDFKLQVVVNEVDVVKYANIAWGAIASKKVGSSWLRSSQYLSRCPSTMWSGKEPETIPIYTAEFVVLTYDPKSEYYLNNKASIL